MNDTLAAALALFWVTGASDMLRPSTAWNQVCHKEWLAFCDGFSVLYGAAWHLQVIDVLVRTLYAIGLTNQLAREPTSACAVTLIAMQLDTVGHNFERYTKHRETAWLLFLVAAVLQILAAMAIDPGVASLCLAAAASSGLSATRAHAYAATPDCGYCAQIGALMVKRAPANK